MSLSTDLEGIAKDVAILETANAQKTALINQLTSQALTDMGGGATFYDALVEIEKQ